MSRGRKGASDKTKGSQGGKDLAKTLGFGIGLAQADDDDAYDDDSLLAELESLQGTSGSTARRKPPPKKGLVSMEEISRMAQEGMQDISDADLSDADMDDEDLLGELNDLVESGDDDGAENEDMETGGAPSPQILSLLNDRQAVYESALQAAKAQGVSSKIRRLERGLKEIENLLQQAKSGKPVKEEDIPPPVATGAVGTDTSKGTPETSQLNSRPILPPQTPPKPSQESGSQATTPSAAVSNAGADPKIAGPRPVPGSAARPLNSGTSDMISALAEREKQYKTAALAMKRNGDMEAARKLLGLSKSLAAAVESLQNGEDIDAGSLPPPLPSVPAVNVAEKVASPSAPEKEQSTKIEESSMEAPDATPSSIPAPGTVAEALQQRLEKYLETANAAKAEGNSSKARRMQRIVKQYEDALKAHKAGRSVDFAELPAPPGYPPIPGVVGDASGLPASAEASVPKSGVSASSLTPVPNAVPQLGAEARDPSAPATGKGRNQQEFEFVVNRQKEFKLAALEAKKAGDIDGARELLRHAKSLDQMILGAQNGMRIDVTQVPSLPKKKVSTAPPPEPFEIIEMPASEMTGTAAQLYSRLELTLKKQIEMSKKNSEHYKLLGNLDAAKNFEQLLKSSEQDLTALLIARSHGSALPKCHYEMKTFPVVKSNPELSDSECEINIVRCVNVPLPSGWLAKDMYVYVTYEFPYPPESSQTGTSSTKKQTVNPEFDEKFRVSIDRKNRAFARVCRRQTVNFKVFHVRGFLKGDKALGQASVKLEKFTNKCEIHESVDLVDLEKGRKSVGGKIEVILKVREPLVDKDAEIIKEKWLVLETPLRGLDLATPPKPTAVPQAAPRSYDCLESLKFEKEMLDTQLSAYRAQGKQPPEDIANKIKLCQSKMAAIQERLKSGGVNALKSYVVELESGLEYQKQKAQVFLKNGDKEGARMCLVQKKLYEKEIAALRGRLKT